MQKIIIDGHNLIPKIPGMHLNQINDEQELIEIISEYCRFSRRQAELFFDGAPSSTEKRHKFGLVNPHFIKLGKTADNAIIAWLNNNKFETKNIIVVSSDHRVQIEARNLGAKIMSSEEFVIEIKKSFNKSSLKSKGNETKMSDQEVEEWLKLFNQGNED